MKKKYLLFAVLAYWVKRVFSHTSNKPERSFEGSRNYLADADTDINVPLSKSRFETGMINLKPSESSHSGHGG